MRLIWRLSPATLFIIHSNASSDDNGDDDGGGVSWRSVVMALSSFPFALVHLPFLPSFVDPAVPATFDPEILPSRTERSTTSSTVTILLFAVDFTKIVHQLDGLDVLARLEGTKK